MYISQIIRDDSLARIALFETAIFDEVLPRFSDIDQRATTAAQEYHEAIASVADWHDDPGTIASDAFDHGYGVYDTLSKIKQMMLNLLATGFFHALEQQLASACRRSSRDQTGPGTALDNIGEWLRAERLVDIKQLHSYPAVDELRLVANAVKHAEGWSAEGLRGRRPELFIPPPIEKNDPMDFGTPLRLAEPLAGEELYVTEEILRKYCNAAKAFLEELAAALQENEAPPF